MLMLQMINGTVLGVSAAALGWAEGLPPLSLLAVFLVGGTIGYAATAVGALLATFWIEMNSKAAGTGRTDTAG